MSGPVVDDFALNVEAGPGTVARWEVGVAVAGGDRSADLIAALQAELGPAPTSGDLVTLLRTDPRFTAGVDLVVAVGTPEGIRVFVRGDTEARTENNEVIAGPDPIELDLAAPLALWLGVGGPPTSQGHPVLDLRRGVVPGRGVVLHRSVVAEPAPQPAAAGTPAPPGPPIDPPVDRPIEEVDPTNPGQPADPAPPGSAPVVPPASSAGAESPAEPVVSGPFRAVDWSDPVDTRQPLPVATHQSEDVNVRASAEQVMGIRCSRDHFNNPKAGYCQVCGISMVHLTHRLEPGPRPTLGFVVFADGATYAVDRPYLIGRSPHPGPERAITPLATQDPTQSVSREHGELRLDGWDVLYVDLGSTNGSYRWDPAAQTWTPLRPHEPVALTSGTSISVGRMTFVFQGASKEVGVR